ncbi:response regulator [Pseudomonas lalucatii]|uniref:Response regulator n=1 Tax=Pseudomonas lalucatii TaxID=1424203 RepID=A0ABS5Q1H5_9PSED|nr:response regulator [Pseudomonas lalucatii]MBS7661964.1 response regulator [Pseudomonas lalucatii]
MSHTVLIADDEPNIVISLEFLLQQAGYEVRLAHDGQQAWESIQQQPPDLVLLDVMLPHLSGFDLCQKIRENPAWARLRIVMLTAKGREVEISKGLALGADAYITKPFSTQDLLGQVRALLGDD